ncbi:DUF3800 domain-containing protein [Saccharospirillum mangrovi]|uniref:DUF3800 domain-containing protein n=1 Tax=Saccharospirillum mangrovi TaxID=2161747 RepID=UPI000D3D61D6|nr:DUF3800 domain-containing protein [Saccharospirillum mangrovi]
MNIFIADETNNEPSEQVKFFIYGGIIVDSTNVRNIVSDVRNLRNELRISDNEKLKFNIRSCPTNLSRTEHTEAKSRILDIAATNNVRVIINCVLHAIARNNSKNELVEMTSATAFRRFNDYCSETHTPGFVMADQWPVDNGFGFLESCINGGISYRGGTTARLPWIHAFSQVSDNSTPLMSVADIVLGSFRWCINNQDKTDVNTALMPRIAGLMWYSGATNNRSILNRGLNFSPREVLVEKYKDQYTELYEHILHFANSL